ncbi:MAG TPA: phosphotransferase, partial [Allosphingosinicella sp.]|nr:phosphotransferase [Allosphingosinicella sp.]
GEVLQAVLQHPLASFTIGLGPAAAAAGGLQLYVFVLAPVLLILLLNPVARSRPVARAATPLLRIGKSGRSSHDARSERFTGSAGYEDFLDALFSDARRAVSGFGMGAVDDCVVHRFYQGGSDALTALVETDGHFVIRKFAMGGAAAKLEVQAQWLRRHSARPLPLIEVIGGRKSAGAYSYDMPLVDGASDFQDSIHSSGAAANRARLLRILDRIDTLHGDTALGAAPAALVERYVEEKIVRNAGAIAAFARQSIGDDEYSINGDSFGLDEWRRCFADRAWLASQLRRREAATIHGDLTVENVIVAPDHPDGLYIIDPNPENIFESPLIDWGKMMQSLHLGYEMLNRSVTLARTGSELRLPIARSQAYADLHGTLESEIEARFGEDGLREVYFHELVNYLRLTTYKIRQSPQRGLAFFGCTSLLLRRYKERFA